MLGSPRVPRVAGDRVPRVPCAGAYGSVLLGATLEKIDPKVGHVSPGVDQVEPDLDRDRGLHDAATEAIQIEVRLRGETANARQPLRAIGQA